MSAVFGLGICGLQCGNLELPARLEALRGAVRQAGIPLLRECLDGGAVYELRREGAEVSCHELAGELAEEVRTAFRLSYGLRYDWVDWLGEGVPCALPGLEGSLPLRLGPAFGTQGEEELWAAGLSTFRAKTQSGLAYLRSEEAGEVDSSLIEALERALEAYALCERLALAFSVSC